MTTTEPVYTIAVLKARPGQADALIAILETLAAETRKEAGALDYGFIRDRKTPDIILSYERWADEAAETAHWQTPHLKHAARQFKEVLDGGPTVYTGTKII